MIADEILKASGDFGAAQWSLLSLFSLVNVFSAFHYFAQTFITLTPRHLCEDFNNTEERNYSLNYFDGTKELKWFKWEFETLTSELNWTCKEGWKSALVQSSFFLGSVTGTLILGILSDSLGRVPVLISAHIFAVLGNVLTVYLPHNVWCLSIARTIAGLGTDTNFFMMYIIVMEYIKPSLRTFGLNLCIGIWYCVGCMVTPWLAVLTKNWTIFLLTTSLPALIIPLSCFFVPESAQWLLSVGKIDEAIGCFKKLARFNRKEISQDFIDRFKASASISKCFRSKGNILSLFKSPCLRRKTCILIFKTMVLTLCYDAISRNIEGLGLDPFTIFTVTSASIFPSCIVILFLQDKVGRKAMAVFSLFLTGVFCFGQGVFLVLWKDLTIVSAAVALLGRFSVNVAYNSGTQYAAELIPTQVRGQGLAAMHVLGYGAAFFSPHILQLSIVWSAIPETILATLAFSGAAFCLFLPETLNKSLPCTIQDGETFGESEKMWDFVKEKKYGLNTKTKKNIAK